MSNASHKQLCLDGLRHRILTLEMEPGTPLDEAGLAQEFGISRTPLREIIQKLAGEGYLTIERNRGAKVASMDLETLTSFFQAAPMIYAAISRLAAERAERSGLDALKGIQQAYRASLKAGEPAETAMHNHAFHRTIGEMANSPYLMPSLDRLLIDHTRIGQTFYRSVSKADSTQIAKAADQHDAMIDAFERQAPAEAVELTREHWGLSRNNMERFIRPDPLAFELGEMADAV